jgi:carboxylesterase type B
VTLSDAAWGEFNRACFTCANFLEAKNTFLFRYFGDWDNLRLYPTSGAYHSSDLKMVFGASVYVSGIPDSAAETKMVAPMQKAWATFAQDPHEGLTKVMGWPRYMPDGDCL